MSAINRRPLIDSRVPMGNAWFDFLTEDSGPSGDEIHGYKVNGDDGASEIHDPVSAAVRKMTLNRFDKAAAVDPAWNEPVGVVIGKREVEQREVFLEKRSSAPGRIRFEIKEVDGERWRYGYNHEGELVSWKIVPPEIE